MKIINVEKTEERLSETLDMAETEPVTICGAEEAL